MEDNKQKIDASCGEQPLEVDFINPGNDPNYVFENDINFETLTLYDIDGNVINVNSWLECAHYVNGGWSNILIKNIPGDKYIFFGTFFLVLIYSIYTFSFNKRKNENI